MYNAPPPSVDETRQLIAIAQNALADLLASLDKPETVYKTFNTVQAAYGAIEAAVTPTVVWTWKLVSSVHIPFSLGAVVDLGLVEVITAAGEKGISSAEIERITGVPHGKASRLLRILTCRGYFCEVRPDVWAHTHHSLALDSGLPYDQIVKEPATRYAIGAPLAALVANQLENGLISAQLPTMFRDKRLLKSYKPTETAFNVAMKTDLDAFGWYQTADGGWRAQAFANTMSLNAELREVWIISCLTILQEFLTPTFRSIMAAITGKTLARTRQWSMLAEGLARPCSAYWDMLPTSKRPSFKTGKKFWTERRASGSKKTLKRSSTVVLNSRLMTSSLPNPSRAPAHTSCGLWPTSK